MYCQELHFDVNCKSPSNPFGKSEILQKAATKFELPLSGREQGCTQKLKLDRAWLLIRRWRLPVTRPQPQLEPTAMPNATPDHTGKPTNDRKAEKEKAARNKVKSLSLGAILLWAGAAWLMDIGWAVALIGIGGILVSEQTIRQHFQLKVEWFWIGAGAIVMAGGILSLAGIDVPIGPVLLIAAGLAIISSIFTGRSTD